MKLLIDGDIVTFRAAFSADSESSPHIACARADEMIDNMLEFNQATSAEVWLSGNDNFRYKIFPEYKANRITAKRPKHEMEVKDYLVRTWDAIWSNGCEADDMLGVRAMEIGVESTIATIDKDLDMIPGWHYNFVKGIRYFVTPKQAIRWFYYQLLVGDAADGIKGAPGIGPVKAERLLRSCEEAEDDQDLEQRFYRMAVDQFSCYEEFEMNAKCLWIWREPHGVWKDKYVQQV